MKNILLVSVVILAGIAANASADASKCPHGTSLADATGDVADCLRDLIKDDEKKCILNPSAESMLQRMCDKDCIRLVTTAENQAMMEAEIDSLVEALGLDGPESEMSPAQRAVRRQLDSRRDAIPALAQTQHAWYADQSHCIAFSSSQAAWDKLDSTPAGEYAKKSVVTEEGVHAVQFGIHRGAGLLPSVGSTLTGGVPNAWYLGIGTRHYVEIEAAIDIGIAMMGKINGASDPAEEAKANAAMEILLHQLKRYNKYMCTWLTRADAEPSLVPPGEWVEKFRACKNWAGVILDITKDWY